MSAESHVSRQSMMTQHSSKSRVRSNTFHSKPSSQDGSSQHAAAHFILQQQMMPNPQQPSPESLQQMLATTQHQIRPPPAAAIITPPVTQIISPAGFIEPQQYLAAIPVQPVAGFPPDSSAGVLSPIPPTSPAAYAVHSSVPSAAGSVVLTPAQNQVQDQLQRKHEELQHLIMHQQEELRRVQEQLLMARYGLLPSIVTLPFTSASSSSIDISSRCSSSTSYLQHHQSPHSSQQFPTHPSLANQPQNIMNPQPQPQPDQHMPMQQDQKPIFHPNQQLNFTDTGQPKLPGDSSNEVVSYMQLTPVPIHHLQQQSQSSQQHQQNQHQMQNPPTMNLPGPSNNSMELLQYQMAEEQAQTLFTSGMEQQQQQQQHLPQSQQHHHYHQQQQQQQQQQMHNQHSLQHHHHQQQQQQQQHHHSQHHHSHGSSLGSPGGSTRSHHSRSDM
ncbi:hypothetical protein RP20_CCG015810 [Aedes albopictus]|nr:hypothetical protein RP20_CCG015810 [Aedes albopictus]